MKLHQWLIFEIGYHKKNKKEHTSDKTLIRSPQYINHQTNQEPELLKRKISRTGIPCFLVEPGVYLNQTQVIPTKIRLPINLSFFVRRLIPRRGDSDFNVSVVKENLTRM